MTEALSLSGVDALYGESHVLHGVSFSLAAGRVHLAGLRLLASHLTAGNHEQLLARAAGRTKDEIAELIAELAPQPAPPTVIRKSRISIWKLAGK